MFRLKINEAWELTPKEFWTLYYIETNGKEPEQPMTAEDVQEMMRDFGHGDNA